MILNDEKYCDGCGTEINKQEGGNRVSLNSAEYDLCNICYRKLLDWFNREITT